MGKGDSRSRRGKIFKKSFGKSRPKARHLREKTGKTAKKPAKKA